MSRKRGETINGTQKRREREFAIILVCDRAISATAVASRNQTPHVQRGRHANYRRHGDRLGRN